MGQVRVIKNNPNLAPFLVTQEQCEEHGAAFFFKQWGGWGADGKKRSKKDNGRVLAGNLLDQMPASI